MSDRYLHSRRSHCLDVVRSRTYLVSEIWPSATCVFRKTGSLTKAIRGSHTSPGASPLLVCALTCLLISASILVQSLCFIAQAIAADRELEVNCQQLSLFLTLVL